MSGLIIATCNGQPYKKVGGIGRDQYPVLTNIPPQVYNSNEGPHRRKGFKLFLHTKNTCVVTLKAGEVHPKFAISSVVKILVSSSKNPCFFCWSC